MTETAAFVVVPTRDLAADVDVLRGDCGFRLDRIMPADDPSCADLSGHGMRVRLRRGADERPVTVEIDTPEDDHRVVLSGGSTVAFRSAPDGIEIPANRPELVVTGSDAAGAWVTGRAGMQYRDLLPGRWGGRFIASHIRIPGAGPVPDDVHFHRIRLQLIAVMSGEVEVVYEDQGEAFVMREGDCVLQPPGIRHRVLRSADDLEVVEVGCPAEHETILDHDLPLPTGRTDPTRVFGGQRFVRHVAAAGSRAPWRLSGWTCRPTGIAAATNETFDVVFAQPGDAPSDEWSTVEGEFELLVVMRGRVDVEADGAERRTFEVGHSIAIPSGHRHRLTDPSPDLEIMEVHVP